MTTVRVRVEIGGQGSERSPSPRPSPARERERLRPRAGDAGAPGWRGTMRGNGSGTVRPREARELAGQGRANEWLRLWRFVAEGRAEIRGQRAESGCNFSSQDAGDEPVRAPNCPSKAPPCTLSAWDGEDGIAAKIGYQGPSISFVPDGTGAHTFLAIHRWKRWAFIGRPYGTTSAGTRSGGWAMIPKSGGEFVLQDTGGKSVSALDCPEIRSGKAEGSSLNAKVRNDEECIVLIGGVVEDTAAGHRGILLLILLLIIILFYPPRPAPGREIRPNWGGVSFWKILEMKC